MLGKFITLEGIDGAGKSTHLGWLQGWLQQRGIDHLVTREPGGTPLGETLRELLLHEAMHLETETLLMFASRREHLGEVILPALQAGRWVVSDRFTDATYAYQGGGRGLAIERIEQLESWVQRGLQPDLTLLFDLPPDAAHDRVAHRGQLDRIESEVSDFHVRVRDAYLLRAAAEPERVKVLSSDQSKETVRARVLACVMQLLGGAQ